MLIGCLTAVKDYLERSGDIFGDYFVIFYRVLADYAAVKGFENIFFIDFLWGLSIFSITI